MNGVLTWVAWGVCWRGRCGGCACMGIVLAWVAWVMFLCGWHPSMGSVGGIILALWHGWCASTGSVGGVLTWVAC